MYKRHTYLDWMTNYRSTPLIKVLVGMRRTGKSTLLRQFRDQLLENEDLESNQILFIDKESLEFSDIQTELDLHRYVESHFESQTGERILFVDEVQEIENWEKALSSLLKNGLYDIYITGSNAHLLSSDLATFLTGRFVKMQIFPFSYREFLGAHGSKQHDTGLFQHYLKFGGFPGLTHLPQDDRTLFQTLDALYSSIILHDIVARYQIRNSELLQRLATYFFDNIGNLVTANSLVKYLKSQRLSTSIESVQLYMAYLESCFALHRVKRFDLKGKRYLEISEKHYLGDIGLRHAVQGYRQSDIGQLLENIVYLELRQLGYTVSIGKVGETEIDFIADRHQERLYIQVAYLLGTEETRRREFAPLKKMQDGHRRLVLTMDPLLQDESGIQHLFLPEFLLMS